MKRKTTLLLTILLLGVGFATVSTTLYLNGNVNISANEEDFDVKFTRAVIDNEDRSSTAISSDGKTITYTTKELQALNDKSVLDFEVTNDSSLYDADVSIECTSGEKGEYYQITKDVASSIPAKTTNIGKVEVQKIKMVEEDIEEAFTCTLTAKALERTTKEEKKPNIEIAYTYSEPSCITGEENTCIETSCYKDNTVGACAPGTIVKYNVNNMVSKYFYVLHDDGDVMTLQQRENTINSIKWYGNSTYNTSGPLTVLGELEKATESWSNANTINYTMGTTVFKDNPYTGCFGTCTVNTYTLENRSSKARMITFQEATALGCSSGERSCPIWMYNYLSASTSYGGTATGDDVSYWTMSASSDKNDFAWRIHQNGIIHGINTIYTYGARAVIEVNKSI